MTERVDLQMSVLLVEDNPGDARLLREAVREAEGHHNIRLTHVDTLSSALTRLDQEPFDVIMLDLSLPDAEGLQTLVRTHEHAPSIPIVVLTGLDDEGLAVRAVREGAQDYLVKGQVTSQLLVRAMRYATERKRAIEALQGSEEYYRSLIENALDVIVVLGPDGTVRYASPSFERVLGYPQGALSRANAIDLLHPEDRGRVRKILEAGIANPGVTQAFECRVLHRNGTWRVMENIGKGYEDNSPVSGYVVNSRDISERKKAEEGLRQASETLSAVIEASPLAIYSLNGDGHLTSWNSAAERIFGYDHREVLGKTLFDVFPENSERIHQRLADANQGRMAAGAEELWPRKDGTGVEVSVWNAQLGEGGVDGLVEAVVDNTERKRLEVQFRQAQKMEAVGRLAGGVAHDFNNLLTVITGYCQMLLDQMGEISPMAEDMRQVLKAADRATALTKQLLAFSRRQIVQPKVVDLNVLVYDMHHMLRRLVGEDIEVAINAAPVPMKVKVDPGHIEQVIVNLVVNARDAMPDGGKVTISLSSRTLPEKRPAAAINLQPGEYVLLEVTDTGTGMTDETLRQLFEPFFTTKETGRGTGLGLSTSYGIVKQNSGEIAVHSTLGRGSTFAIYLPRVSEPVDKAPVSLDKTSDRRGGETILLTEDEEGVRNVMTEMLRKCGYTVLVAAGGHQALQMMEQYGNPVHLLVTDVVMPRIGGHELAGRLRVTRPDLKVLYVSGYTDGAIAKGGILEQGTDLLQKPFSPDQFVCKVREVLDCVRETERGLVS